MEEPMRVNQLSNRFPPDRGELSKLPRYYFHLKRGQVTILDQVGVELTDLEEAVKEAARRGRQIAKRGAAHGGVPTGAVVVVADEQWQPVLEVPLDNG
jgi:hypothetical protein